MHAKCWLNAILYVRVIDVLGSGHRDDKNKRDGEIQTEVAPLHTTRWNLQVSEGYIEPRQDPSPRSTYIGR